MSEHTGTRIHPCYILEDVLTLFTYLKSNFTKDTLGGRVSRVNTYRISTNSFRKNYSFLKVENVEIFI